MKMSVDRETTLKMASAAQLRIAPEDVDHMTDTLNDILDICALVGDIDTDGTPDFTWKMKKSQSRRPDTAGEWADRDAFMAKAPATDGDFFKVPRIVTEE